MSAREEGVKLPETEWWEVFDVEREELGFLVVGVMSLEGVVRREGERWGHVGGEGKAVGMINREMVRDEMGRLGLNEGGGVRNGVVEEDEEAQMARLLDEKVAAVSA